MCFLRRLIAGLECGVLLWHDVAMMAEDGWLCSFGRCYQVPCYCPSIAALLDEFAGRDISHHAMRCYWVAFLRQHLSVESVPEVGSHRPLSSDAVRPAVSIKRRGCRSGFHFDLYENNHIIDCSRWASPERMCRPLEALVQNGGGDIGPPLVMVPVILRSLRRT